MNYEKNEDGSHVHAPPAAVRRFTTKNYTSEL
jgi:hypothetical protein